MVQTTLTALQGLRVGREPRAVVRVSPAREAGIAGQDFEEIVRAHQRRIFGLLLAMLGDADTADTLTQETFLRAYRRRASFRGEAGIGTWLLRIAVNLAIDHRRNRRAGFWRRLLRPAQEGSPADDSAAARLADPRASPERALVARQELEKVWAAAGELPGQQRAIFLLRFAEEMTLEEIAETLELQTGTVKSHLFRAVGAVRKKLKR